MRALDLGSEFGRNDVVKNSHYLLAETYSELGREDGADEHYEALAELLPGLPRAEELSPSDQPDGDDQPEGIDVKTLRIVALCDRRRSRRLPGGRREPQQRTLLTADGTLYDIRSGLGERPFRDLAGRRFRTISSSSGTPTGQDGTQTSSGVIPGTANQNPKTSLDLTFDETTDSLVVLWREENPVLNKIRLAIFKAGGWSVVDLLPNPGFPHAYNPRMLLTHQTVRTQDEEGQEILTRRSILSVIWWEESSAAQARYVPIFLDEEISRRGRRHLRSAGSRRRRRAPTPYDGVPRGAYAFPTLQSEGPGGGVLASFATLASKRHMVVRINFPSDLGTPGPGNMTWLGRRIPVVGDVVPGADRHGRTVFLDVERANRHRDSYLPTLHWRTVSGVALHPVQRDRVVGRQGDRPLRGDELRARGGPGRGDGAPELASRPSRALRLALPPMLQSLRQVLPHRLVVERVEQRRGVHAGGRHATAAPRLERCRCDRPAVRCAGS